jgi:hypothetical protein
MKKVTFLLMGILLLVFTVNIVTAQAPPAGAPAETAPAAAPATTTEPAPAPATTTEPAPAPAPATEAAPAPAGEAAPVVETTTTPAAPTTEPAPATATEPAPATPPADPTAAPATTPAAAPAADINVELEKLATELGIKSFDELKAAGEKAPKAEYQFGTVEVATFGTVFLAQGSNKYGWNLIRKADKKNKVAMADQLKDALSLKDNDKMVKALLYYVVKNGTLKMEKNKKGNEQAIFSLDVAGKKIDVIVNSDKFKGSITFVTIGK